MQSLIFIVTIAIECIQQLYRVTRSSAFLFSFRILATMGTLWASLFFPNGIFVGQKQCIISTATFWFVPPAGGVVVILTSLSLSFFHHERKKQHRENINKRNNVVKKRRGHNALTLVRNYWLMKWFSNSRLLILHSKWATTMPVFVRRTISSLNISWRWNISKERTLRASLMWNVPNVKRNELSTWTTRE